MQTCEAKLLLQKRQRGQKTPDQTRPDQTHLYRPNLARVNVTVALLCVALFLANVWLYILTVYLVSGMVHLVFGKIPKNKLYFAATLLCGVVQLPQLLSGKTLAGPRWSESS